MSRPASSVGARVTPTGTMTALRYHAPRDLRIEQVPVPTAGPGDLLIAIAACGVCATDVKTYLRGHPKIAPGTVLGHEVSGTVIAAPAAAPGKPGVGDRVAVAPYCPCRECRYCRRGQETLCENLFARRPEPGGFTEYLRVPAAYVDDLVVVLPDAVSDRAAALGEPLACGIHAMEACGVVSGDDVVIIGDGPMGLLQAVAARVLGASRIVLAGLTPARLAVARGLADTVIDVTRSDLVTAVRDALPDGADAVLVSVAVPEVAEQALALARRGGVVDLFAGLPGGTEVSVDAGLVHYEGVRVQGSFGFAPSHFRTAIGWLAQGLVPTDRLITDVVDLAGLPGALERSGRHLGIKTVMEQR